MKHLLKLFVLFLFNASIWSAELAGVKMEDVVELDGQKRVLNGMGLRLATFIKIKVYVAGLYVSEKSSNAETIIKNTDSKILKMSMLRNLEAKQLKEAFEEGFQKACLAEECEKYKNALSEFLNLHRDVNKGQSLEYVMSSEKIDVLLDSQKLGSVLSSGFASVIIKIWIGNNPPNSELKNGLLGIGK